MMLCEFPGLAFSEYCHFAGVPVEERFVAVCTTVKLPASLAILDLVYFNDVLSVCYG